jgi:hypothetical protein
MPVEPGARLWQPATRDYLSQPGETPASLLTRETSTERVQFWFELTRPGSAYDQRLVVTEFASALSVKIRQNQLSVGNRAKAASLFTRLMAESLIMTPFSHDHLVPAAAFANQYVPGPRAGDALHVAVADVRRHDLRAG